MTDSDRQRHATPPSPSDDRMQEDTVDAADSECADESTIVQDGAEPPDVLLGIPVNFGRYRLLKVIGEGGMGRVFLAEDSQLGRQVALKVPRFSHDGHPDILERFLREARTAAQLRHANICPMFDVGDIDGIYYLTMAFIQGEPLTRHTQRDTLLPARDAANLVSKLAKAMHEAHKIEIIHRDLKPDNIMIDAHGEPIIMDFGLARQEDDSDAAITTEGSLIGTPAYMSPEQVNGDTKAMGPSSDIYSLGVILYELLCGQRPFNGSKASVMAQVAWVEAPPLAWTGSDAEPALQPICSRCLSKMPGDRFATALEMAEAIDRFAGASSDSSARLIVRGKPKVIEPSADNIETYSLAAAAEAPGTDEPEDGARPAMTVPELVNDLEIPRETAREKIRRVRNLLGETRISRVLIKFCQMQESEEQEEWIERIATSGQSLISRHIDEKKYEQSVNISVAMHIACGHLRTLDQLIGTIETVCKSKKGLGKLEAVLDTWNQAISEFPTEHQLRKRAVASASGLVSALLRAHETSMAVRVCQQAVQWDSSPTLHKALLAAFEKLAAADVKANKFTHARQVCQDALEFAPEAPSILELLRHPRISATPPRQVEEA